MSEILFERAELNQYRGKVNELHFVKALRGNLTSSEQAEHDRNAAMLGDHETGVQHARAEAQVKAFLDHARRHGYTGVKAVHHTAQEGDITRATGHEVSQQENPSDALVEFRKGPSHFLGASLKSTKGKQIGFHNGGAGTIGNELGLDLEGIFKKHHDAFAKQNGLSPVASQRKQEIKADPKMYKKATEAAHAVHSDVADTLHKHYSNMNHEELRHHLLNTFLKVGGTNPVPYVKVTGTGGAGRTPAGAHTEHHDDNPVANSIRNANQITTRRSGKGYINVLADGKPAFNIQVKHNSTGMATSGKILGQPASQKVE